MVSDADARMMEELTIGMLKAHLDRAKQYLSEMNNIANDDLDMVQFNAREFLRESVELVEGLVWANSCRNWLIFVASARSIADRWAAWEKTVVKSDDPPREIQKEALGVTKRWYNQAVKLPAYQRAGKEMADDAYATTGQKLADVKIPGNEPVASPTDETDTMGYTIMSAVFHANFVLRKEGVLRPDDMPILWVGIAFESACCFKNLLGSLVHTVLGDQAVPFGVV